MIKINTPPKFPIELVALYSSEGKYIGHINQWQMLDVRIQIAEQKLEGYSIRYPNPENGEANTINIDSFGKVSEWPEDTLFDQNETLKQCIKLRTLQLKYGDK